MKEICSYFLKNMLQRGLEFFLKKSPLQRQMTVHNIKQCKKYYQKMNLFKKI